MPNFQFFASNIFYQTGPCRKIPQSNMRARSTVAMLKIPFPSLEVSGIVEHTVYSAAGLSVLARAIGSARVMPDLQIVIVNSDASFIAWVCGVQLAHQRKASAVGFGSVLWTAVHAKGMLCQLLKQPIRRSNIQHGGCSLSQLSLRAQQYPRRSISDMWFLR